ncbi:signal transduction histidine kinase [Luteibacter rhizovicinus]|uniref:histidine kinase n=1 Tax=Luteibacter rhizovicinus TaxID=242606 RepID=A0A4V2W3Z4_9GAMM|nr:HAMP domain-containing sensor histidine kinase [Luteibacter rhizovicinus]TCV93939.1 signal transduction histidine kinase [Luteibacter rhizovicinus]
MTASLQPARRPVRLRSRLLLSGLLPMTLVALTMVVAFTATYMSSLTTEAQALATAQAFRIGESMVDAGNDEHLRRALQLALTANPPTTLVSLRRDNGRQIVIDNGAPLAKAATYRVTVATPYGELTAISDARPSNDRRTSALWFGTFMTLGILAIFALATCAHASLIVRPLDTVRDRFMRVLRGRPFIEPVQTGVVEFDALDECIDKVAELRAHHEDRMAEALRLRLRDIARQTRFVARFGDHFRQPLQAMGLFVAGMQPGKDLHQRAALAQIGSNLVRMTELLDALMEMARFDAGIVEPLPVDLIASDLFVRERDTCAAEAHRLHVDLRWRGGRLPLHSDGALLGELLHRLVANAMASAPHGRVLVAARRRGRGVRIEVRDNGVGIDFEQQERIFEEFVRLPGHVDYGLGLTIARRIADVLGGQIGVRSRPGAGSTFWVEVDGVDRRGDWNAESTSLRRAS